MDIEKEKSAFLDIYKYYPSAIKFTFDVENECFVLSKKNPLDHEVEVISQMNQQWQSWLACAKSKEDEIDNLIFEAAEMKSRLNDNYTAGQTSMYLTKQAEIDDLKAQLEQAIADTKRKSHVNC